MSTIEKLIHRVLSIPSDLTYNELKKFLEYFGYRETDKGRTSGSRVGYLRDKDKSAILLHKPHPENIVGKRALRAVIEKLKEQGDIDE